MKIGRSMLAVALGAAAFVSTWWIEVVLMSVIGVRYGGSDNNLAFLISYLPAWTALLHTLLPGLVAGYFSPVRPAAHGATAAAIGATLMLLISPWFGIASALHRLALDSATGAILALAGAHIQRMRSAVA